MRAISVDIFKSSMGDCSNGGISSRYKEVLIACVDGNIEVDMDNIPENFCYIDDRFGHKFVRPYEEAAEVGWMAGGSVVYSWDNRFRKLSEYPLMLHDRQEGKELYASMD